MAERPRFVLHNQQYSVPVSAFIAFLLLAAGSTFSAPRLRRPLHTFAYTTTYLALSYVLISPVLLDQSFSVDIDFRRRCNLKANEDVSSIFLDVDPSNQSLSTTYSPIKYLKLQFNGGYVLVQLSTRALTIIALILLSIPILKRHLRPPLSPTLCPRCHYDLRATPTRCPECGHTPAQPLLPAGEGAGVPADE